MFVEKSNDIRVEAAPSATVLTLFGSADTMIHQFPSVRELDAG